MAEAEGATARQVLEFLIRRCRAEAAQIGELDAKAGDGDLGVTLTQAMDAVEAALEGLSGQPPAAVVRELSRLLGSRAASTFTTLIRLAGSRAAQALEAAPSWEAVGAREVAQALTAALEAAQERGQARPGQKTFLDALAPAAQAAHSVAEAMGSAREALQAAARAARHGAEETASMTARAGRAAWMAQRGIGFMDPGAVVLAQWLESLSQAVGASEQPGPR